METVGLIGLGLMGSALAGRLMRAGFGVTGYDIDAAQGAALAMLSGHAAGDSTEVVAGQGRVLLSLPNLDVVSQVLHGAEAGFREGQIIIDTSTGDPEQTEAVGRELAKRGVSYLDATISGNSAQVAAGDVTVMVGGPREAFDKCLDLFRCFARQTFHVGPCGAGAKMKLVTNLVLGLNRATLAEGLALAKAVGLDLAQTLEVLRESPAYSRAIDVKGAKLIAGDFAPQARLSQHLKDVRLMLEAASRAGIKLILSEAHRELLERAEAAGLGQLDNSAVIRVYEQPEQKARQK